MMTTDGPLIDDTISVASEAFLCLHVLGVFV